MVDKKFLRRVLNKCNTFLRYFGILIFGRISYKLFRGLRRILTKKKIPFRRNLSGNSTYISHREEKNFPNSTYINVIYNGLNSTLCDITIFKLQTRNVIKQCLIMGYRIILICDRSIKKEIKQMISEIRDELRLNDNNMIILKTCRAIPNSTDSVIEINQDYFKKKLKNLGRNHILFNNCTVTSCLSLDTLNNYILISTIFIKSVSEYMVRNKGEFIIIGLYDKFNKSRQSNSLSNSMAYNYFKNLHYLLKKEYNNKIQITFIENRQDSFDLIDNREISTNSQFTEINSGQNKFHSVNLHKINLQRKENIQLNSYFSIIFYYIVNFRIIF